MKLYIGMRLTGINQARGFSDIPLNLLRDLDLAGNCKRASDGCVLPRLYKSVYRGQIMAWKVGGTYAIKETAFGVYDGTCIQQAKARRAHNLNKFFTDTAHFIPEAERAWRSSWCVQCIFTGIVRLRRE